MNKQKIFLIFLSMVFAGSIFATYLIYRPNTPETNELGKILMKYSSIIYACQYLCYMAKNNTTLNSQCLSDMYPQVWEGVYGLSNWVCDVAHRPRKPEDNLKENQCKAWLNGLAHNFVEVDPNCTPITLYVNGKLYHLR